MTNAKPEYVLEAVWRQGVPDEAAVARLAARFAEAVQPPLVLYLRGDLGAGKTTFARAYIHALGYQGYVKSPSYGLLETYEAGGFNILHLDLYRIEDPEELEYLALRDLFGETGDAGTRFNLKRLQQTDRREGPAGPKVALILRGSHYPLFRPVEARRERCRLTTDQAGKDSQNC